ncbi:hypothetical protein FHS85_002351 [Rhodoligotrophos appendicifer]|uniref:hypothetical protein n=1 Tax=Rhodoligotrophos appendicifer TaxID=987056 RepID=UPI001185D801|nr:hypothetical protein [Rhodoligotrophos appendicifer]
MAEAQYEGFKYSVNGRGANRWHWAIFKSDGGLPVTSGMVDGGSHKADEAAKKAIDRLNKKKK